MKCESCGMNDAAFAYGGQQLEIEIEMGAALLICEKCAEADRPPSPRRRLERIVVVDDQAVLA